MDSRRVGHAIRRRVGAPANTRDSAQFEGDSIEVEGYDNAEDFQADLATWEERNARGDFDHLKNQKRMSVFGEEK